MIQKFVSIDWQWGKPTAISKDTQEHHPEKLKLKHNRGKKKVDMHSTCLMFSTPVAMGTKGVCSTMFLPGTR